MISAHMDYRDVADVKEMLKKLSRDESRKAMARGINKTMTGVRTDGTKILTERYALTATEIRKSWKIKKAPFKNPHGVVSSKGTFIRLIKFGARPSRTGVSVKVLRGGARKVIKHAYIGHAKKGQRLEQVYRRKWDIVWPSSHKKPVNKKRAYAKLPLEYRFPVEALYGPRLQDHLGDGNIFKVLTKMAGDRLLKNMKHEVEYLLSQAR